MLKKTVSGLMLVLLLTGMSTLAFNFQPVRASGTIYIKADGSVDPPTAPISTTDNVTYTLTDNINGSIVIERNNIVVDGAGYTLQGLGYVGGYFLVPGINMTGRDHVTIENAHIANFSRGIWMSHCSGCIISNNNIAISVNGAGLLLEYCSNNTLSGNNITKYREIPGHAFGSWAILLYYSLNNSIFGNNITNCYGGIHLVFSGNNTLSSNSMANNDLNFGVLGQNLSDFVNHVDIANIVEGKPIYYWINKRNMIVPVDAGYVALINCTHVTVQNLNLTKNSQGVLLAYTTNSTITNNNMTNNYDGIRLCASLNNSISGNNITTNNENGIYLQESSNNGIYRNKITNNIGSGIWLDVSSFNNISGNNVTNNWGEGFLLYYYSLNNSISENNIANNGGVGIGFGPYCSNNSICHNNFKDNGQQVYIYPYDPARARPMNVWDDGYPSGGNYWSDYSGVDLKWGSDQSRSGSDGIGDTAYVIDGNNRDRYPLMKPWAPSLPKGPCDLNGDGKVDIYDVVLASVAYGSRPGDPNWNSYADLAPPQGIINIYDIVTIAVNCGKTYP